MDRPLFAIHGYKGGTPSIKYKVMSLFIQIFEFYFLNFSGFIFLIILNQDKYPDMAEALIPTWKCEIFSSNSVKQETFYFFFLFPMEVRLAFATYTDFLRMDECVNLCVTFLYWWWNSVRINLQVLCMSLTYRVGLLITMCYQSKVIWTVLQQHRGR